MTEYIETAEFREGDLWCYNLPALIGYHGGLYSPKMVFLPASAVPSGTDWLSLLAPDDWYKANGGPCLILGEAGPCADEKYRPRERYLLRESLRVTAIFRNDQRVREERVSAREKLRVAQQKAVQERLDMHMHAEQLALQKRRLEQERQAARGDPLKRLEEVEARLKELEARQAAPTP